jgi:hypothetical protein
MRKGFGLLVVTVALAAQPALAATGPITGREWKAVISDWLAHRRFSATHSCAAVVVARTHAPPRFTEGTPLVHALDLYERQQCPTGDVWAVKLGMTDREVATTAGPPIPWRSGPRCWSYHATRAGTSIDGGAICFTLGRVSAIRLGEHG